MKAVPLDAFARRHLDGKAAIESIINDKIRGKSLSFDRVADEEGSLLSPHLLYLWRS